MATVTGSKRHLDITSDTLTTSSNVDVGAKLFITTTDTNTTSTSALVLNSTEVETRTLGSNAFNSTAFLTEETFSSSDVALSLGGNDIIAGTSITLAGGLSYNDTTNTLSQTDTQYNDATTSTAGLMSTTDKSKLDGIESGADVTDSTNVATAGALMATGGTLSGTVKVTGSIIYENDADSGYIPFPKGAQYQTKSNSHTGAIKITLPTHGGDDMVKWVVDIYDYSTGESVTMFMGGYIYQATGGNEWVSCTVTTLTEHSNKDYTVRFGADGTNSCVWIGETNSTWSYPQVIVRDFVGGFITDIDAYDDDWSISFVTSFDTVDETISDNLPTADWDRIEGKPTEFTPASHTHSAATTSANGFMSSTDKTKLDGIETSADVTDATNVAAAGALMTSGGTISGDLTVNGKLAISGVVDREEWGRSYVVSNTNIKNLLDSAGNGIADGGAYRVVGHIDGTGTDQASSAVFWNQNGTWYVNVTGQSGTSSNHIQFLVNGGKPAVKTYHSNDYTVRVSHERLALEEGIGTDNARYYFGADSYMSDIAGTLKFQGTHNIWHAGNSEAFTTADHTKLDGIASGAEVNVQANWNETTTTSDAYINNKPTLGTAAASAATDFISATNADTAAELIRFSKGISTDGHSKFYNWRALNNSSNSGNFYWKIAEISGADQSSRFIVTLAGRSTSYADNALPAMGHIVGQLNNDNNWDLVFYNHSTASSEVVTEVAIVDDGALGVELWIKTGNYAEITASGHISDGSFTVVSNASSDGFTASPDGYTVVTEYTAYNSGNTTLGTAAAAATTDFAAASHTHSAATTSASGFMSSTDKTKLDGVATGADVTPSWVPSTDPNYLTSETFGSSDVVLSLSGTDVTAGESITLAGGLSYSGTTLTSANDNTTYTAGAGLTLTDTTFSVTANTYATAAQGTKADNAAPKDYESIANLGSPDAISGTWVNAGTTDWGTPRIGSSTAKYTDGTGYIQFNIPDGMKTAYLSQLTWSSGGYFYIYGIQSDGGAVLLRVVNSKNSVENANEGNPNQHDGSTTVFAGTGLDNYSAIRIQNKSGRLHLTGLGFTSSAVQGSEGMGLVHPSQLSTALSYNSLINLPTLGTAAAAATTDFAAASHTHSAATTSAAGFMSTTDKTKLDGIETSADVTDTANVVAALTAGTNVQISDNGTISATDTDTVYTHPTTAGNKHIPTGGSAGQFLKYSSSGTAVWATPSYTTNTDTQLSDSYVRGLFTGGTNVSITAAGVISSTDTTYSTADFDAAGSADAVQSNLDTVAGNVAGISNQSNTDVDTGTETIAQVSTGTYTAAFFDFVIKNGTNVRAGTVYSCHDGTNVEFTETSTVDLGDTSDVSLSVDISGTNMRLRATTTSNNWSVKSLVRAI